MNYIQEYWNQMQNNEITVSKRIYKQYEKLISEIDSPGQFVFDVEKANKPIHFIETFCKSSKGRWAGTNIELELFQKAYIAALFGFIDKETGFRRYKESMFYVARKNGKTTMLAGIALFMFIADGENGAEIYSLASKRDQAALLFDEAHNMIKQNNDLSKHIRKRKSDLYFDLTMSKFMPLSKNSNSLDGVNGSLVVIDELHSITDRNIYEVMKQSQSAREEPLLVMITTAGTMRGNIFDDMYDYACNVVDGNFTDDTFLPIMYELDEKEEWKSDDVNVFMKANPTLGTIKNEVDLLQKIERAINSPNELTGLLTKDFNIRDSVHNSWLTFDEINNEEIFNIEDFNGAYAIGGADLSITTDLSCATLLFVDPDTEKRYVHQMFWLPRDNFQERVELDKIPYDKWYEQGLLRLCNGNTINYGDITAWFMEMLDDHSITPLWIYYDNYSARYWVEEMEQHGFKMERCIQGARTLSLPMQQMGQDLKAKKINYNNHPILKWNLTNTGIEQDRNANIVPVKNQTAKMRIDGMSSMLDAYVGLFEHYEEFLRAL